MTPNVLWCGRYGRAHRLRTRATSSVFDTLDVRTLTSSNNDLEGNFDLRLLGTAIFMAEFSVFKNGNPGPKPANLKPPISKFMITGGRHVNQYRVEDLAFRGKVMTMYES